MNKRMKDSGIEWIGEIPEEWEVLSLGKVSSIQTGNTPSMQGNENYYENGELHWVKPDNLEAFVPIEVTKEYINQAGVSLARIVPPYTPLVCCIGSIGKLGYSQHFVAYNQQINSVSFFKEKIYWKYGLYYLSTQEEQHWYYSTGNVVRILNSQNQKQIKVPVPPLPNQQKIATFLDQKCSEIDHILEKTRESIEEYKKLKQSIITEAVTKGLNRNVEMKESGVEWIGEIPRHWEVSKLKYTSTFNPSCNTADLNSDTTVTFLPMECLKNGYFENRDGLFGNYNNSYVPFQNQDIILAKVTPCFENGNISIVDDLYNSFGYGSSELFVVRCKEIFNKYMYFYLQNTYFKGQAVSTMTGTGGLKRVSPYFMKNAFITVPPSFEQQQISNFLDQKCSEIDSLISQKETLLTDLEAYKKSLIFECVTGKREVGY